MQSGLAVFPIQYSARSKYIYTFKTKTTSTIAKVAYGGNFKKCLLGQMTVEQHILELQNIEVKNYNIIKESAPYHLKLFVVPTINNKMHFYSLYNQREAFRKFKFYIFNFQLNVCSHLHKSI